MGVVYKLDFMSGKSYIGLTTRPLSVRISQHRTDAKKRAPFAIHRAWRKYGEPIISVVAEADGDALKEAERKAIRRFNTLSPRGYNLSVGGDLPDVSEETRQRMSQTLRGRTKSEEHRAKIGAAHIGRVFSEETKRKMSASQKARDPATRNFLGPTMKGKKFSAEHIEKRVAAYKAAVAKRNSSKGA